MGSQTVQRNQLQNRQHRLIHKTTSEIPINLTKLSNGETITITKDQGEFY